MNNRLIFNIIFRSSLLAACIGAVISGQVTYAAPFQDILLFENFEGGEIYQINPSATADDVKYIWNQYDNINHAGPGQEAITSQDSYSGNKSLAITVDQGNMQAQFYPYSQKLLRWLYTRETTALGMVEAREWRSNHYNRMRFWMKVPETVEGFTGGRSNFIWGTYTRCSTCDTKSAESGNGHWYHMFNVAHTGEWHQIIVDYHPNHQRGSNGNTDEGVVEHPTGEENYNYFDLLTRFYFDIEDIATPYRFLFDSVEFYYDPNDENIEQIYSLNAVYRPTDYYLYVGWMRDKAETVNFEVRYSFNDIHDQGWDNAIPAPNGIVSPLGSGGYNAVEYITNGIDAGSNASIYIAIKPVNSDRFRQIIVPNSIMDNIARPNPPTNVTIINE